MYEHLKIEERGMVAIMTISAPKSLNALNSAILNEIGEYLDEFDTQRFRCLVITGDGEKSFVAGADISEMAGLGPEQGKTFGRRGAEVFRQIGLHDLQERRIPFRRPVLQDALAVVLQHFLRDLRHFFVRQGAEGRVAAGERDHARFRQELENLTDGGT